MFKKKGRKKREVQPVSERKLAEPPKVTPGLLNIGQKNSRTPFAKTFEIFIDEIVRKLNL